MAVDLRILQANERTLLAWVRTGLSIMAIGFVIARIGLWDREDGGGSAMIGAGFIAAGAVFNAAAALRYVKVRRAIIEERNIVPGSAAILSLALGLSLVGGILAAAFFTR